MLDEDQQPARASAVACSQMDTSLNVKVTVSNGGRWPWLPLLRQLLLWL